jgi:hypothetical protein
MERALSGMPVKAEANYLDQGSLNRRGPVYGLRLQSTSPSVEGMEVMHG